MFKEQLNTYGISTKISRAVISFLTFFSKLSWDGLASQLLVTVKKYDRNDKPVSLKQFMI